MHFSPEQGHLLLDVARATIRDVLGAPSLSLPNLDDPALQQPAGCFVSLHNARTHRLRGCIGCLDARYPLLDTLRQTADSVLADPRFANQPVTAEELPSLSIELSVITPLSPPLQDPLGFDLLADGIYLSAQGRAGCFLPQVARETGWDRRTLLQRLCTEKLNLPPDAWKEADAHLRTFATIILGPEPFVAACAVG